MFLSKNMPANFEMMVYHSSVISQSPPASFLSDYTPSSYARLYDHQPRSCRPQVLTPPQTKVFLPQSVPVKNLVAPKSCLITRLSADSINDANTKNNNRAKKKVIFADDQGLALTEVRVMSEPSSVPPLWSLKFLAQITQGLVSPYPSEQWTIDFRQPASDYLQFRSRIDELNVSLENVIVKETESIMVGTIKVKNISFNKEVIVRATWDNWKSQEDIFCTYSQIYGSSAAYVLYDTFSFKITLPPASRKLEFCVCFRSDGKEYWDNNNNQNYTIVKKSLSSQHLNEFLLPNESKNNNKNSSSNLKNSGPIKITETAEYKSKDPVWSEYSSWNQSDYPSPYW